MVFLDVDLHVVLFFKIGDRIFNAGRLLDVFPDVKLRGGVYLHRERREDQSSEYVLFSLSTSCEGITIYGSYRIQTSFTSTE